MSLAINMPKITRVLLADGWHDCQGISIDAYEFGVDRLGTANGVTGTHGSGPACRGPERCLRNRVRVHRHRDRRDHRRGR